MSKMYFDQLHTATISHYICHHLSIFGTPQSHVSWDNHTDQSAPGGIRTSPHVCNSDDRLLLWLLCTFAFQDRETALQCTAPPAWFRWASANSAFSRSTPWLMRCLTMCLSHLKLKNGEEHMTCGFHGKSNSVEVFKTAGLLEMSCASLLFFFDCSLQILCTFKPKRPKPISNQHLKAVLPMLSFHGFITHCPTSPFFTEASAKFLQ